MVNGDEFRRLVLSALDAHIVAAGGPVVASLSSSDEENAINALAGAAKRLRDSPSLLSGDPEGVFTFEDPILAVAALWHRRSEEVQNLVVSAGSPGEDLQSGVRLSWMLTGIHAFLSRGDHAKVELGGRTPRAPVNFKGEGLHIAVTGDAGYKGLAQDNVVRLILDRHSKAPFDFVIHLGDVYFAGGIEEMTKNFLSPFSKIRNAGTIVYSLIGNHDLYYGGEGYLFALNILGQPGRYFLIENAHWRIACLDTALGAERILANDAKLDEQQLEWFDALLRSSDPRPLLLMSHHYILSGWEPAAASLVDQLGTQVKDKVFAWYWGHEHSAALYGKESFGFYGACIGNGSFLAKWSRPNPKLPSPEWYPTGQCTCFGPAKKNFWQHGYIELELSQNSLIETVWLEDGSSHGRTLAKNL